MSAEVVAGIRLALKRWPVMVTLATMVSIASLVLSLVVADVLTQVAVLRGGAQLRERQAVTFKPYYPLNGFSDVGRAATQTLVNHVEQTRAYTAVIGNVQIEDPTFADGHAVVVLIGDAVRDVFPDLRLCSPAPCAMVGHKLEDQRINPIASPGTGSHLALRSRRQRPFSMRTPPVYLSTGALCSSCPPVTCQS